jgi:hypothetical protein
MTRPHGSGAWDRDAEGASETGAIADRMRARPSRRAADHHYRAVVAAEIRRLAGELGPPRAARDPTRIG